MPNTQTYKTAYGKGTLKVSQNSSAHNEDSTTAISAWDWDGKLKANFAFSQKDTEDLIAHLQQIVADNKALKPKVKTVRDAVKEMKPGTVFDVIWFGGSSKPARYSRTVKGVDYLSYGGHSWTDVDQFAYPGDKGEITIVFVP